MSDDKKLKNAQNVYKTLCEMMDEKQLKYDKYPEDLVITFVMSGEDIPMQFVLNIDADRELIRLISPLPVTFEGDKRVDGAIATCHANYRIADGSFDFDYKKGKILFRMTSSYMDSLISKDLFEYMVAIACYTVDEYNDKFLMLSKGLLTVEQLFEKK
ncbi:MAG: YbjN domain-containing protein [Bacteroides sp.]|nr:YbjN domain-containing protein [Bacillota bacterium]MCM1394495.1 YbjN domain-containing protein [[Eubacterium] siraeum]MCM1456061.1 YbjN domain-containing protein [Bacteroides sp.]